MDILVCQLVSGLYQTAVGRLLLRVVGQLRAEAGKYVDSSRCYDTSGLDIAAIGAVTSIRHSIFII